VTPQKYKETGIMKTGTHFPEVKEYNRPAGAQGGPAMKRKQGFTLVELLVVMAIIAILAAIVVPNVQRYIVRARVTRAIAEINGVELAMTAMLTDSGKGNLNQLFNGNAVRALAGAMAIDPTNEQFMRMTDLYTAVIYDLLRYGRNVLRGDGDADERFGFIYGQDLDPGNGVPALISKDILAKLGTNYMDLGADPWGNEYKIFAGPWKTAANPGFVSPDKKARAPIPFRKFTAEGGRGARDDGWLVNIESGTFQDILDDAATWPTIVGYPADTGKAFYVWSFGENGRSSQLIYQPQYVDDPYSWYNTETGEDIAGGDDINNWDPAATWQRFYN